MACGNQQESGKPCQKKVQDQGDGTYRCEKCNTAQPSFNWRMIMRASMADCTDNQWVNMFNVSHKLKFANSNGYISEI